MYKKTAKSKHRQQLKTNAYVSACGTPIKLHNSNSLNNKAHKEHKQFVIMKTPGGTRALDACAARGQQQDIHSYKEQMATLGRPTVEEFIQLYVEDRPDGQEPVLKTGPTLGLMVRFRDPPPS